AGLDAAIVHAARILPLNRIADEHVQVCLDLIYDRRDPAAGYDPLQKLLELFEDVEATATVKEDRSDWSLERRLSQRIIDGDRDGLTADLDAALAGAMPALDIINDVLLEGSQVVGEPCAPRPMQLQIV